MTGSQAQNPGGADLVVDQAASETSTKPPEGTLTAVVSPKNVAPLEGTQKKPDGLETCRRNQTVRAWAEADPAAAAAWASQLPAGAERSSALEQVAIAWANADLQNSVRWFDTLPEEPDRATVGLALGYEAARTDPRTSLDILATLPPSTERDEALAHSVSQWASTDFRTAAWWATNVPDPVLKSRLVAAAAIAGAEDTGAGAADLASRFVNSPEDQGRAAVAIVQRWAQTAPEAASDWVGHFPDTPIRALAIDALQTTARQIDGTAAETPMIEPP